MPVRYRWHQYDSLMAMLEGSVLEGLRPAVTPWGRLLQELRLGHRRWWLMDPRNPAVRFRVRCKPKTF
jgi:hypothetical protein